MKITIVSATDLEVNSILDYLENTFERKQLYQYQKGNLSIDILVTGVGSVQATYGLSKYLAHNETDQLVIVGVGGISDSSIELGKVFLVDEQEFFDLGVMESDGSFRDLFDLGLAAPDLYPFSSKKLKQAGIEDLNFLPKVKGITVNTVSGTASRIERVRSSYDCVLESMEGAAYAYVALSEQVPYFEIRSVSNYIEPRDKNRWELDLAIERLSEVVQSMISSWIAIADDKPTPEE